jgi:hypothetical protein
MHILPETARVVFDDSTTVGRFHHFSWRYRYSLGLNAVDALIQPLRAVDTVTRGCTTGTEGEAVIWKVMLHDGWPYLGKMQWLHVVRRKIPWLVEVRCR